MISQDFCASIDWFPPEAAEVFALLEQRHGCARVGTGQCGRDPGKAAAHYGNLRAPAGGDSRARHARRPSHATFLARAIAATVAFWPAERWTRPRSTLCGSRRILSSKRW